MSTLLHRLRQVLNDLALNYNQNDEVAPAAILWTDGERQWEPLLPRLRQEVPHLFTLGAYDPAIRTGPAIYLKTIAAGALPEVFKPDGRSVPVLYLPGVSMTVLRADLEHCSPLLQPLAELRFRGRPFLQLGGNDWTVNAFLVNPTTGLGLDVAKDQATQTALRLALVRLGDAPLAPLLGKRLEAADFQDLAHSDATHHLLLWLNDTAAQRAAWAGADWDLFVARCRQTYGVDPQAGDGRLEAARRLGQAEGPWAVVWARFVASPRTYPGVVEALRSAKPAQLTLTLDPHWPQDNTDGEQALRQDLAKAATVAPHLACAQIVQLESQHGVRRSWVWAALGQAPLATALEHLADSARRIPDSLDGPDLEALMAAYRDHGWLVDAAVTKALQATRSDADLDLVSRVLAAIYPAWLDRVNAAFATRFQATPRASEPVPRAPGRCILFADGLRFDVGQSLTQALRDAGLTVDAGWSVAALPTVTATAKPAQAPLDADGPPRAKEAGAGLSRVLRGDAVGQDFKPIIAATGKVLTPDSFKALLAARDIQVLDRTETGDPAGCAWTEHGRLDESGHNDEVRMCRRIPEEIESLRERIADLLAAGWAEVVVTTDHGWMLVPGGMPKRELPAYLAETRWSRAAVVKAGSDLSAWTGPVVPWAWDASVAIAMPPGCHAFIAGKAYAHGGLSLQECVLPRLTVRRSSSGAILVRFGHCVWRGLRAVLKVQGAPLGSIASIRVKAGDAGSTISQQGVPITADPCEVRLLVADSDYEGQSAAIVVCDATGTVLAKRLVTIGEEDTP